jgi:hypothetical protein
VAGVIPTSKQGDAEEQSYPQQTRATVSSEGGVQGSLTCHITFTEEDIQVVSGRFVTGGSCCSKRRSS